MNTLYNAFKHQLIGKHIRLADYDISGIISDISIEKGSHHMIIILKTPNNRYKEYKLSLVTLLKRTVISGRFK